MERCIFETFNLFEIQEMFLSPRTDDEVDGAVIFHRFIRDKIHRCCAVASRNKDQVLSFVPRILCSKRSADSHQISLCESEEFLCEIADIKERNFKLFAVIHGDAHWRSEERRVGKERRSRWSPY